MLDLVQLAPDNKIYGNIPGFNSRYLHMIWETPLHLVLFDAYSRIVLERRELRLSPTATLLLEELPPGPYFYSILQRDGQVVKSGKVIRTR